MERKEIEERYKWNLSGIFTDDNAWEKELSSLENGYDFSKYRGKLSDKTTLLELFSKDAEFSRRAEKLYLYASTRHDEDVRRDKYISYQAQVQSLYTKYASSISFVEPEIISLPKSQLKAWIEDRDFSDYDYLLSRILRQKAHVLSEQEDYFCDPAGEKWCEPRLLRGFSMASIRKTGS